MTAHDFIEWLDMMWFSDDEAARRLSITVSDVTEFKCEGTSRTVGLACAAIAVGVPSWTTKRRSKAEVAA